MEGICASSSWGSTDRVKDPKLRMQSRPQPPPPTQSRRGAAYEDFGSDFTKKDVQGPSKPGAKVKARARPTSIDSGSSDELDSLPPTRAGSRAGSEIEIVEDKKTGGFEEKKPLYSTIPRGLRFKKMPPTTTSQGNDDKLVDLTSSQPTVLNEHGNSQPSGSSRPIPLPGISRPNSPRGRSPAPRTPAIPRQRGQTTAPTTRATTPPTQNRPKPRPLNKGTSTPQLVPKAFPGTDLTPRYPSRRQTIAATPTRPSPPRTCNNTNSAKRKAAEFPHLSPRTPAKFPLALDSPKKGKRSVSETVAAFKPPQPRAADKKGSAEAKIRKKLSDGSAKARNKTIISSEEEEKEDDTPQAPPAPKAQPFPMSTQAFDGIGLLPPAAGPSSLKRSCSGSYDESESKRMKEDVFDLVDAEDEHVEPNVDPSTLCPYCDGPLPSEPTPQLRKLLATAEKRSRREPRPGNRLGRTAPFIVYISICQRHRFESQMLPEAERKGWPKTIDWIELGKRVRKMRNVLRAIIEDTGADGEEDRPKARCVFWREAVAEVKQKGTRAVAGVKGQFASFEKMQPG
ncbi:hypothetical protein C0991_004810 [Blastosporella zonata]|nr:hypothetical protein C0991_004810 [Blastosporella zonata]